MQRRSKLVFSVALFVALQVPPALAQVNVGLHQAALMGDLGAVRHHIEAGTDLNEKDTYGSTPLVIATTFGMTEIARALIVAGADLTISNNQGSTPLHLAAFFGHTEIVRALLEQGADRFLRNDDGSTAFDIAAAPFDRDRQLYDQLGAALGPLGLRLDYGRIEAARPQIMEMLRPAPEELELVRYAALARDDWKVSTPGEQGLDPTLVAELYLDASEMETLRGLVVIKNGHLIAEGYFNDGSVDQEARLQSVTKSFTSALFGIALDRGCLSTVDQRMIDFFPEVADSLRDPRKEEITIRQLLQMRSGYPWEETDSVYWGGLLSGRYPRLIKEFPLTADPGTQFQYSNLSSNWLGIIVDRACGAHLKAYAEEHLFRPLAISAGEWGEDAEGHNNGCADLHLTARDAARFGLLYLNNGKFEGKRVVAEEWVRESLESYSESVNSAGIQSGRVGRYLHDIGYGYQWWSARVGDRDFNLAWGHGGQFIVLLHDLDMVIVVTSKPFYLQHDDEAWKHEQANLNLLGKFISSLPGG